MRQQNEKNRSPSEIAYDNLISSQNSVRRGNAHNVKLVCDQMERDGVEILLSQVAQRCIEQFGQPGTSTITNTGSKLGEYIRLRRSEQNVDRKGVVERNAISNKLSDPVLAQEVKILEETVKQLRMENNGLRNAFRSLNVDVDNGIKRLLQGGNTTDKETSNTELSVSNNRAVDPLLSNALLRLLEHLASRNYQLFRGRYGVNNKAVLSGPEFEALKSSCNISESEWAARFGADSSESGR